MLPEIHRNAVPLTLPERRAAVLARIRDARRETAEISLYVADDLEGLDRKRRAIISGWRLAQAAGLAAGFIWSIKATSHIGRGRRFVTLAISLLSTMRAMRRVGSVFNVFTQSIQKQGSPP